MSNEIVNRKVLGLDALQYIKEYIDRVSANTNNRIDIELKDYIGDRITTAANAINSDYTTKYNELIDRIAQAESEGNAEKIHQLELELSRLQGDTANKFSALEGLAADLTRLSGEYDSLYEGITTGSVFTAGQLDEIINTAMIKSTKITDDMVETPNLYTSNVVALIAKFGQINAANIVGGSIKGHTIESNNIVTGSGEPVWAIKDEGEGWLANGNISWDRDGNVTFGDQARISFNNVDGAEEKLDKLMHGYDDKLKNYVNDFIVSGITGTSVFTSIVFTRADHKPSTPEGGDYYNPIPTGTDAEGRVIEWTDHIPVGDKILWSSTRVFASTNYDDKQQPYWSDPVQLTDTSTFDVDFSNVAENPGDPTTHPENWTNTGDETSIWMATRTIENGVESEWQVMKIKGEKGQDGKSINVKGSYDSLNEFKSAIAGDELNNSPADANDCYVVGGDLWVWGSTQWINIGRFAGTDGITTYVYIKYANNIEYNEDGTLNYASCECSANGGEKQGRWMGLGNGTDPNDPIIDKNIEGYNDENWNRYKWTELVDQSRIDTAVVTEFGKYDIKANLIKGKTIQTTSNTALINGTNVETFDEAGISTGVNEQSQGPAWQLRNRGDGYLAKGNISWDENGDVTFGEGVKLKWNQIDDASDAVSTAINTSNATLKTELETNIETAKNELNTAITTNEQAVQALTNSINSTKSELESKYDNQIATINNDIVNANNALAQAQSELLTAIQNGDAAAIQNANDKVNALQETVDSLSETANNLTSKYNEQKNALDTLKNTVEDLQISNGAGLTESQVNELISTAFIDGTYIQSDSIESPNVFTTNLMALVAKFGTVKASNVTSGILQGSTVQSNVSINGNYSGDVVEDPTWRITNDGAGYLAKGNIEWTDAGDLTVKSVNGAVTIGEGVGVGPWKTFTENNVDFIGDGESFDSSKNVFGQDGTFKVGGNTGFVKSSSTGAINVGSDVVFGSGSPEEGEKIWRMHAYVNSTESMQSFIYIGKYTAVNVNADGTYTTIGDRHVWIIEEHYNTFIETGKVGTPTSTINGRPSFFVYSEDSPEQLENAFTSGNEYSLTYSYTKLQIGEDLFIYFSGDANANATVDTIKYELLDLIITKDSLSDWWDKTEISGNKIKTGTIDASKVTVTNLNADNITAGKIAADKIDVDDLTVKNLNTSGEGIIDKGTINIQNNDLTVYSNTVAGKPVLKITGNSLDTLPQKPAEFSVGKYLSGYYHEYLFGKDIKPAKGWQIDDMRVLPYHDLFIGEFEVPDDATYYLSKITDWAFTLQFNTTRSNQSSAGPSIYAYAQTYIIDENSNIPDQPFEDVIEGPLYEDEHRIDLYRDYDGQLTQTYSLYGGDLYLNERAILSGNSYTISSGKYKIYCRFAIDNSGANQQYNDIRISSVKYSHTNVAKITPSSTDTDMSRVDISSYGFRYIINDTKYVTMTKNGSFILRNGNNILAVDDEGIAMSFNGSLDNVQRIVPQEFVFRTDMNDGSSSNGSRWNKMTVLCLGSPVKVDNGD